jgi:hypothetical protein
MSLGASGDPAIPAASAVAPSAPAAPAAQLASRFKVEGIVSIGANGFASIAVGGAPARRFKVGDAVDGDLILESVSATGITLASRDGARSLSLEASPTASAGPAVVTQPTTRTGIAPRAPLADGSAQAQETLRKLGSRHAPIAPQAQAAASTPVARSPQPVDDGRWRPATQP